MFQTFNIPKQNKSISNRQQNQNCSKLTLTPALINNSPNQDIGFQLLLEATNHSFTKRMSQGHDLNLGELLLQFCMQKGNQLRKTKSLAQSTDKWYIVQIDEGQISQKGFLQIFCDSDNHPTSNSSIKLKLYHLIFYMQGREMQLISLQNPKNKFIINLDLIEIHYIHPSSKKQQQIIKYKLQYCRLLVDGIVKFDIYITPKTIPKFTNNNKFNISQICKKIRNQLQILIRKYIVSSQGSKLQILSQNLISDKDFLQKNYATEQQFSQFCQTGDILLFKDNHTMAKVQRFITRSQYDHVAVVYRSQNYGICLFQSNSGTGVGITIWNQLIRHRWYENIQKVAWRRLITKKQINFQQKVTQFIKNNLNKKFGFSFSKLLKFESKIQKNAQQDQNKTYFCSELVATLYKYLQLLDPYKSSTQYWPKDFSTKGDIRLLNGYLQSEKHIIFEPKILMKKYPHLKNKYS